MEIVSRRQRFPSIFLLVMVCASPVAMEVDVSVLDQQVADGRAARAKLENEKQLLKEKPS